MQALTVQAVATWFIGKGLRVQTMQDPSIIW